MARNPAADPDADGSQFFSPNPDASEAFDAMRGNAVIECGADEDFFEIANVPMNVTPIRLKIDDGVSHDLAGPVIRYVAPAARFADLDAASGQLIRARENMAATTVAAHAECQDMRMLD
jgi:hypothetical protein